MMNRFTGRHLDGFNHLRQSIADILSTPIGTRVMRRDYGSRLPELVDRPFNAQTRLEMYAATAEALRRWESRFRLHSVQATQATPGRVELTLEGLYLPAGSPVTIEGVLV